MAFFDLVVEVAETFGFLVITLVFLLSQVTLLNLLHSMSKQNTTRLLVPNLYLTNVYSRFTPSIFL